MDPITWLLMLEDRTLSGHIADLGDGAGLTRFGITQKNWGKIVPAFFWTTACSPAAARVIATNFYRTHYWNNLGLNSVSMPLAASVLSCAVNIGANNAASLLAQANIASINPNDLLNNFIQLWSKYYHDDVAKHPAKSDFLNGWLKRAATIYPNLP